MSTVKLEPFTLAGVLDYCPECGATGDYELLKERVELLIRLWEDTGKQPMTPGLRYRLGARIEAVKQVINMKEKA